jgi:glycopeptide antibiotics resistance protein
VYRGIYARSATLLCLDDGNLPPKLKIFMKNSNYSLVPNENYQFLQPITLNLNAANSPGSVDKTGCFWYQYQYNIIIFIKIINMLRYNQKDRKTIRIEKGSMVDLAFFTVVKADKTR